MVFGVYDAFHLIDVYFIGGDIGIFLTKLPNYGGQQPTCS